MAYTIRNTDGTILLTLAEGKVDTYYTSLTLVGKNVANYGEYLNNNFVSLLENFASTEQPSRPSIGQLWYDLGSGRMKVYDPNSVFRPISNTLAGDSRPIELAGGDFWFDTANEQLYFSTDGNLTYLVGPKESVKYGVTGAVTETVNDISGFDHDVLSFYDSGKLTAIMSTSSFIFPTTSTHGFTSVGIGLNLNPAIQNIKFQGTATNAESINGVNISNLVQKTGNQTVTGVFTVQNDTGFQVQNSLAETIGVYVGTDHVGRLIYRQPDRDLSIQVQRTIAPGTLDAIYIKSTNKRLGIWNNNPLYALDVSGDTYINGNLYVAGTTTNITSVSIETTDNNIELATGQITPDDTVADYGGLILHGTTDHKLEWRNNGSGWNFNDNVNIQDPGYGVRTYQINGTRVLYYNKLGEVITSAPGLTSLGTLSYLTVTNVFIYGNTVGTTSTAGPNQTLYLRPLGSGTIDATNHRITNVTTATTRLDAANKAYVDDSLYLVGTKAYGISVDVTNFVSLYGTVADGVERVLNYTFPIANNGTYGTTSTDYLLDIPDGVRARVLCAQTYVPTVTTATVDVNFATDSVDKGGVQYAATVVSGLSGSIAASLPPQTYLPVTTYFVQTWRVLFGVWTQDTTLGEPSI